MASISLSEQNEFSTRDVVTPMARLASNGRVNIYHSRLNGDLNRPEWEGRLRRVADSGFTHVCIGHTPPGGSYDLREFLDYGSQTEANIAWVAETADRAGLGLLVDITPLPAAARTPEQGVEVVQSHLDPRRNVPWARPTRRANAEREDMGAWWSERLRTLTGMGAKGFRCLDLDVTPTTFWRQIREAIPQSVLLAWLPAQDDDIPRKIAGTGFDLVCSPTNPWDVSPSRFLAHQAELNSIAPSLVNVEANALGATDGRRINLGLAASASAGIFLTADRAPKAFPDITSEVAATISLTKNLAGYQYWKTITPPGSRVLAMIGSSSPSHEAKTTLLAVNTDPAKDAPPPISLDPLPASAGGSLSIDEPPPQLLKPGEFLVTTLHRNADVLGGYEIALDRAWAEASRVVIEDVRPSVEDGAFPAKTIVGRDVAVTADILTDGHTALSADLLWRPMNTEEWQRVPMEKGLNDRWSASVIPRNVGMHGFLIEAWVDEWEHFVHGLKEKLKAGVPVEVETIEGRQLIERASSRSDSFNSWLNASAQEMLSEDLAQLMRTHAHRPCLARSPLYRLRADRPAAEFASWYELFPRSATNDRSRHGTFRSVIDRLPAIRYMGFDVLYFPPIHPIGQKNRKGRNNSLKAAPGDVGSPYAIGGEEGGHTALHPELGTVEDFKALVAAAREHELEIAMDIAIQCSPDHPWVREHPDWFEWRPDGTIRYAENPPKKYEDIVNPDFYAPAAFPGLWHALRDVIEYWVGLDVRIFRVDNPHTKPLPFWNWMIADIQSRHPDVIFLAEAFTRPKLMYRLGQVGFTQSYTYFTWRNTKQEITEYLTELSRPPVSDFYRPNFFVNTPDINPPYLQTSGRPGFLVRAALATTLSGLWGMYSGFEICESAPLPGREEYLDSEKYEIRPRDYDAHGNIVGEIARLNRLRRLYPALQTHMGVEFFVAQNDNILLYGKRDPIDDSMILVAVNLDPHHAQTAVIEVPLWRFGLRDDEPIGVTDLWRDVSFTWFGKYQQLTLDPADLPFAIWRLENPR